MCNEPGKIAATEKLIKNSIGLLALFGLAETLRQSTCPVTLAEARKVIYTPGHTDLIKISELLNLDVGELKKRIANYLEVAGGNEYDTREIFLRCFTKE